MLELSVNEILIIINKGVFLVLVSKDPVHVDSVSVSITWEGEDSSFSDGLASGFIDVRADLDDVALVVILTEVVVVELHN